MKRNVVFAAAIVLFALAVSASAQKAPNFSGTWVLDASKSKPAETFIESQTIVVTQTAADMKVERTTTRKADQAGRGGGGGGRGMMMGGGGDGATTYTLDGKAVKSEMQGQMGSMQITTTAKMGDKGLTITRSVETPMGARESSEKWWLNADGTLTIESTRPNRDGGTDTTTRTYTKKA
jgi:hypothetical protein